MDVRLAFERVQSSGSPCLSERSGRWEYVFIFGYHINEPVGELSVTTSGRTYVGNPPALTLYEKDRVTWEIALLLIGLVLVAGVTDLLIRTLRHSNGLGILAIAGGGLLVLYSLFGLI